MKSKMLLNLALIAALVALSLYAYFKPWQEAAPVIKLTPLKRHFKGGAGGGQHRLQPFDQ